MFSVPAQYMIGPAILAAAAAVTVAEFPFSPPTNKPVTRLENVVVAEGNVVAAVKDAAPTCGSTKIWPLVLKEAE